MILRQVFTFPFQWLGISILLFGFGFLDLFQLNIFRSSQATWNTGLSEAREDMPRKRLTANKPLSSSSVRGVNTPRTWLSAERFSWFG